MCDVHVCVMHAFTYVCITSPCPYVVCFIYCCLFYLLSPFCADATLLTIKQSINQHHKRACLISGANSASEGLLIFDLSHCIHGCDRHFT